MTYEYQPDRELEEATNRYMLAGAILMLAMVAVFPLYRWFEPTSRDEALEIQLTSLAQQGEELWGVSCSSCHGLVGEGGIGPALNSKQFLQSSTDEQTQLLIGIGVPGSQMSAYGQEYGGPLTSEQIRAISIFIRGWEDDAPDLPDWRAMVDG